MITNQFNLGIHQELFVDNFAGGGGASTGIERALGRAVDHAINHNAEALGMHTGEIKEVALTKEQQIRMCGNSVCPPLAQVLVSANVPHMCLRWKGQRAKVKNQSRAQVQVSLIAN